MRMRFTKRLLVAAFLVANAGACGGTDGTPAGIDSGMDAATGDASTAADGGVDASTPGATCTPACTGNQVCDDHQGAGSPTCTARCTYDGCDSSQNCDLTSGLCLIAAACDSTHPDPDTCSYGQYCSAADVCDYVSAPTCSNFSSGGRSPTWNPATSHGPVITRHELFHFASDNGTNWCSAIPDTFTLAKVRIAAYRTTGTFASQASEFLTELHYVKEDGSEGTGIERPLAANYVVSEDGKNASVDIYLCVPGSPAHWVGGLTFDDGNEVCVAAP